MLPQPETTPHRVHPRCVLILNRGSSSLRFALFTLDPVPQRIWSGTVERIGSKNTTASWTQPPGDPQTAPNLELNDERTLPESVVRWIQMRPEFPALVAVGHRVVHGMHRSQPERVTPELIQKLRRIVPLDPEHLIGELDLIEAIQHRIPTLPQVVCFYTAFHQSLPRVARILPLPRRFEALGLMRFGFHGIACAFLMEALKELHPGSPGPGRVILAHLGSGASMTAVRDGRSLDTTMGFTPAGGLPMGTRCGDLDPGVVPFLIQSCGMSAADVVALLNRQSGMLGISETSSDMRDLLRCEASDVRAAEAIAVFCHEGRKRIGALAAVLGGLDTLVFAGGIGENCPAVRARMCEGLQFLGIEWMPAANAANAAVISAPGSRVTVRVLHTDEEGMMARSVQDWLTPDPRPPEPLRSAAPSHSL